MIFVYRWWKFPLVLPALVVRLTCIAVMILDELIDPVLRWGQR
jgi:hypothetical protein